MVGKTRDGKIFIISECHVRIQANNLENNVIPQNGEQLEIAGKTDIGHKRILNEDNLCFSQELGLAIIADGMGGHEAGEVASRLAIDELHSSIAQQGEVCLEDNCAGYRHYHTKSTEVIRDSICAAGEKIHALNRERGHSDGMGMGTTLVAAIVDVASRRLTFANVGDSRLYRYRNGVLEQLTVDHTAYQVWLDTGRKGPAPKKNIILRALGPWPSTNIDIGTTNLISGDILLMCSDGLHDWVSDNAIQNVLASMGCVKAGCEALINLANNQAGKDNVSVILMRYN